MKAKPAGSAFRPGPQGACEAHLFCFVAYSTSTAREGEVRLIAGASLLEAARHLAKREPEFRIRSVEDLGVIVLLSGSPYS